MLMNRFESSETAIDHNLYIVDDLVRMTYQNQVFATTKLVYIYDS